MVLRCQWTKRKLCVDAAGSQGSVGSADSVGSAGSVGAGGSAVLKVMQVLWVLQVLRVQNYVLSVVFLDSLYTQSQPQNIMSYLNIRTVQPCLFSG